MSRLGGLAGINSTSRVVPESARDQRPLLLSDGLIGGWLAAKLILWFRQKRFVVSAAVEDADDQYSLLGNGECDDHSSPVADDSKPRPDVLACSAPMRERCQLLAERNDRIRIPCRHLR